MEERYPPFREDPKVAAAAAFPPAERPPRPPPSILDRFSAMLREREEDLREAGEEDPPPPTGVEIVRYYHELLGELTFNSKPIITELTIIAGQYTQFAKGIADAICARVLEVPADQKLPSLYLLDSIVKNIRGEYVRYFAARLPKVFCQAYNHVHPSQYPAMRHLFGTWSPVFHHSILHKIEDELQFSPSESQRTTGTANLSYSESPPHPPHGIHVNPKYLEAQRQFKHSSVMHSASTHGSAQMADFEDELMDGLTSESPNGWSAASPKLHDMPHGRGVSSSLQVYGQQSSAQYCDDFDSRRVLPLHVGMTRASSPLIANDRPASIFNVEDPLPHSIKNMQKPVSPRTGLRRPTPLLGDRFSRGISPNRVFERSSPLHPGFVYGPGKLTSQNGRFDKNWALDDGAQPSEAAGGHSFSNGVCKQDPRQLIDAYGNHREKDVPYEKLPKLRRLDANGITSDSNARKWSSGEEEYAWEDMSPTLADRTRCSIPPFGSASETFTTREGFPRPGAALLDSDIGRQSRPGRNPLPAIDEPAVNIDDRMAIIGSVEGSMNKRYSERIGIQKGSFSYYQSSHCAQDPAKHYMFSQSLQQNPGPMPQVRVPQLPPTGSRILPSTGWRLPPAPYESSPKNEMLFQRSSTAPSGSLNVDTSSIDQHFAQRPHSPVVPSPVEWHSLQKTHTQALPHIPTNREHLRSVGETRESNRLSVNQGHNSSLFLHRHPYDAVNRKMSNISKLLQTPCQNPDLVHSNQPNKEEGSLPRSQSQKAYGRFVLNVSAQTTPHLSAELPVTNLQAQGHGVAMAPDLSSSFSVPSSAVSLQNVPTLHGPGLLPPLPPGPPPSSLQVGPGLRSTSSVAPAPSPGAFSGLLSTLMAKGLISLTPSTQSQDSVGVEFNADLLKERHEPAINALHMELPRQCTTCGLRFKCQEEHSSHMDWHVTKNRVSKNRKQKPSRKWFVSAKEWLSGAETLGNDFVPGFLPTDTTVEKKEDNEMVAVPADENQTVCALCGEPFEDFYCDETEEWMYKGAVYMNAPGGNLYGLDRSQLGPIIHSKCRSESADASLQV